MVILIKQKTAAFLNYRKFGNSREDFIFTSAKFRENKTLANSRNHSVVYRHR